jgi:hypothetical protein
VVKVSAYVNGRYLLKFQIAQVVNELVKNAGIVLDGAR